MADVNKFAGRILTMVANGAEVVRLKDMGYIVLANSGGKRRRRTQEEMARDKKKEAAKN